MSELDRQLEDDIAPILPLLDALPENDNFRLLDARERRQRIPDGPDAVVPGSKARAPLLLLLENLQWIDEESRAFLDALIIRLPQSRLLLAMNFRPEFEHDWKGREGFNQLSLDPLQPEAARAAAALLGEDRSLAPLCDLLVERCNGNPFSSKRRSAAWSRRRLSSATAATAASLPRSTRRTSLPQCRMSLPPVSIACRPKKNCCYSRRR